MIVTVQGTPGDEVRRGFVHLVTKRMRPRYLVASVVVAWVAVATFVPLASALPPAIRKGAVIRHLQAETSALVSGWTREIEVENTNGTYFPFEWSFGQRSVMMVDRSWHSVALELAPVNCPDGKPQTITFGSPGNTVHRKLVLARGFNWYSVPLGWLQGAEELTLSYRCVVVPPDDNRPLAVAVGGIVGHPGPTG
jgi:hypothetical protein